MKNKRSEKTVVVGMSGGVDSSVAALLLKKQGYNVIGIFMKNWTDVYNLTDCNQYKDYKDAEKVCHQLEIPLYNLNLEKEYREKVFANFLEELKKGATPNPDILCNSKIKFGDFFYKAKSLQADFIATGHYAQIKEINNQKVLCKAKDLEKDQTYFLYAIPKERLQEVIFPIGNFYKSRVREIAKEHNIVTAEKKDSTGICFIGKRNFKKFLQNYFKPNPGEIKTLEGETIGKHEGVIYYTIGQRKGLGIGGRNKNSKPWYVVEKDIKNNILYVVQGNSKTLYSKGLKAININWLFEITEKEFFCKAKFRYKQKEQDVKVTIKKDNSLDIFFKEEQRAITKGQAVVLYKDEVCLGGGIINEVYKI